MAKKVFLQDENKIEILPITRGELVLDSSGKVALHSNEFLATDTQPGLMSKEDKIKINSLSTYTLEISNLLSSGKKIATLDVGGTSYNILAPATYTWSEITDRPTKLSQFTDDVVSGKYLPLGGGNVASLTIGGNTAIHSGNVGNFEAGDAKKLGGIPLSRFVYGSNDSKTIIITEEAFEQPLASGFYAITGASNLPTKTSYNTALRVSYASLTMRAGFDLLIGDYKQSPLYFRPANGGGVGNWKTIAFTDSDITGNAATASLARKLQTTAGYDYVFASDSSKCILFGHTAAANGYDAYIDAKNIYFRISDTPTHAMRVNSSGNVTIGSTDKLGTSTTTQLYVDGGIRFAPRKIWGQDFDGTGNVSGDLHINQSAIYWHNDKTHYCIESVEREASSPYLKIAHYGGIEFHNAGIARMFINQSGNVTIGASDSASTNYKLYVNGSTFIYAANAAYGVLGTKPNNAMLVGYHKYGLLTWLRDDGNAVMQVGRVDGTATAYNLTLQHLGGNVLIGTTTDNGAKLQVSGNVSAATFIGNLDGTYVNKLTGYTKATAISALAATDTLNTALGKLEYKADVAYNLVKGAYDGDGTIENLEEILRVLDGIKDTDTIQAIVGKYLPLSGGTITGYGVTIAMNDYPFIRFNSKGTMWGYIGFSDKGIPSVWDTTTWRTMLHSGNIGEYAFLKSATKLTSSDTLDADLIGLYSYQDNNNPTNHFGYNAALLSFKGTKSDPTFQLAFAGNEGTIGYKVKMTSGTWQPWKTIAFTDSTVDKAKSVVDANGNALTLLHSGNYSDYALPITGGTIKGTDNYPLIIKSGTPGYSSIRFMTKEGNYMTFGYKYRETDTIPDMFLTDKNGWSKEYYLLHSGNVGDYAIKKAAYFSFENSVNVAGYGGTESGWLYNGAAMILGYNKNYRWAIQAAYRNATNHKIVSRYYLEGAWTDWKTIAFTDSNITGNAATATALQYSVSLWGNDFDGTEDVSGALSGVTDINGVLHINSSGYVGIGIAAPQYRLDVLGTGRFTGLLTANTGIELPTGQAITFNGDRIIFRQASDNAVYFGTADINDVPLYVSARDIYFRYKGTSVGLSLRNTGNILINQSGDAGYRLDVGGTGRFTDLLSLSGGAAIPTGKTLLLGSESLGATLQYIKDVGVKIDGNLNVNGSFNATSGSIGGATIATQSWVNSQGFKTTDTTYSEATTSAAGLMSAADKVKLNYITGYTTRTSVASVPIGYKFVKCTISAAGSFSLASTTVPAGREIHVIIYNSSSADVVVSLPTASAYVNLSGDTLTVPATGYAEINIISDGNKLYIRNSL